MEQCLLSEHYKPTQEHSTSQSGQIIARGFARSDGGLVCVEGVLGQRWASGSNDISAQHGAIPSF